MRINQSRKKKPLLLTFIILKKKTQQGATLHFLSSRKHKHLHSPRKEQAMSEKVTGVIFLSPSLSLSFKFFLPSFFFFFKTYLFKRQSYRERRERQRGRSPSADSCRWLPQPRLRQAEASSQELPLMLSLELILKGLKDLGRSR